MLGSAIGKGDATTPLLKKREERRFDEQYLKGVTGSLGTTIMPGIEPQ
jgi:hypothetical protein